MKHSSLSSVLRAAALSGLVAFASALHADVAVPLKWFSSPHWKPASGRDVATEVRADWVIDRDVIRIDYSIPSTGARYAGAYLHQGVREPFLEFRFNVKTSVAGRALVRFIDKDGETLQYVVPVPASPDWTPVSIKVDKPSTTFAAKEGATLNKQPDYPLTGVIVGIELPKGVGATDEVMFSGAELIR